MSVARSTTGVEVPAWAVRAGSELRTELEGALRERLGSGRAIAGLKVRPNPYRSSFALHDLDVTLDDGTRLELLLKNLSWRSLRRDVIEGRPAFLYDPLREIEVYRELLEPSALGTPAFYGAVVDPTRERFWLLIERVAGFQLAETGEFGAWEEAARRLARIHECLGQRLADAPAARSRLVRYDTDFYRRWARRTAAFLETKRCGERVRSRLRHILMRHDAVVEELLQLPTGIAHGEFYSFNVIVQQSEAGLRVCPVDWEAAGCGPVLVDLAGLTAGSWTAEERRALACAYRGVASTDDAYPGGFFRALDLCRLHVALQWTGWSERALRRSRWNDWAAEAIHAAEALGL
jgi:aminoglycoside phosphotransferase (APT) family kinase protein